MKIQESYLARRKFLGSMVGGGVAALGAGMAVPVASYVVREEPLPKSWEIDVADLLPGTSKIVTYGKRMPVLVFRTPLPENELKVFAATCTHFDCTVGYVPEENHIHCACHDGYYDLDGQVTAGPPPRPLREFFYEELDNGQLVIALEKENLAKAS